MRIIAILSVLLVVASFTGCKKSSDNPVSTTNEYTGTWKIYSYSSTNGIVDSIVVNLNMNGNNGVLTGSGNIVYGTNKSSSNLAIVINGNLTGAYSDSNISVVVTDKVTSNKFTYAGTKQSTSSGLGYTGNAVIITSADTLDVTDLTFYKSN